MFVVVVVCDYFSGTFVSPGGLPWIECPKGEVPLWDFQKRCSHTASLLQFLFGFRHVTLLELALLENYSRVFVYLKHVCTRIQPQLLREYVGRPRIYRETEQKARSLDATTISLTCIAYGVLCFKLYWPLLDRRAQINGNVLKNKPQYSQTSPCINMAEIKIVWWYE